MKSSDFVAKTSKDLFIPYRLEMVVLGNNKYLVEWFTKKKKQLKMIQKKNDWQNIHYLHRYT